MHYTYTHHIASPCENQIDSTEYYHLTMIHMLSTSLWCKHALTGGNLSHLTQSIIQIQIMQHHDWSRQHRELVALPCAVSSSFAQIDSYTSWLTTFDVRTDLDKTMTHMVSSSLSFISIEVKSTNFKTFFSYYLLLVYFFQFQCRI